MKRGIFNVISKKRAVLAGIVLFVFSISFGIIVVYLTRPIWQWGTGEKFFRFDGRAVFAEMAVEPAHSVYGSKVHVWVYRDDLGNISEILVTGHAASKVCVRASVQLYETAIQLDEGEGDLLGAGVGRFLGVAPNKLDALRKQSVVREYEDALWILSLMRLLGADTSELEKKIAELERDELLKMYLRPKRLEDLVASMKRLERETGLVEVIELDASLPSTTRAEVERQIRLNQWLPGEKVSIVQVESIGEPGHAVFLPFYYTTSTQVDGPLPYLIIELDAQELAIPRAVVAAHLEAIVAQMKEEAERRRDFAQKMLQDAENLKRDLELDVKTGRRSRDELIRITHTIDWETLRVIELPEPEQMRLGEYLDTVLPGIIRSAQVQLALAMRLLKEIEEAAKPQGRLAELNQAIIVDSFLRDWDLAFFDEKQAKAYDDWRVSQRGRVWRAIDRILERLGVNPQVIKQENVVFHVEVREGKVLITPYFIADGGGLLIIIDSQDGLIRYVNPWALRKLEFWPEKELPAEVRERLRRKETWAEARKLLAAPLLSKVVNSFDSGGEQEGKDALAEALVLDPRGTAGWLIEQYRTRQVDTSERFRAAQSSYQKLALDVSFLDAFQDGWRHLALGENEEAIQAFDKACELEPGLVDPLVGLAIAYLWSGNKAEYERLLSQAVKKDPAFVQRFAEAWRRGELIYSSAFEALKARIEALPLDTRRQIEVIKHIQAGDGHWQKHEYVQALWEYMDALQLNTEFNEPYQRIIDVYWELGMYQRALEAAFLRLSDPVFGLELQGKPLRISSPNLKWDVLSNIAYENIEKLAVQTEASTLTVFVNDEPVLRLASSREEDITHLAQFFGTLRAQRISPIGNTVAERLLNTAIPPFPEQQMWAEHVFFSEDVGDLVLKAMVYGGVPPSFLVETKVKAIATHALEATAPLGTRKDAMWETKDIVARVDYPKTPGARVALREDIARFYTDMGREVVSIDVSSRAEILRQYAPKTRWEVLWGRITRREGPMEPHTMVTLPRGLAIELIALLIEGRLFPNLPAEAQAALLGGIIADARALNKLVAWGPAISSGLSLKVGENLFVVTSKGLLSLSQNAQHILEQYKVQLTSEQDPVKAAEVVLNRERWQVLLDDFVAPLLERVNYQVLWVKDQPKIQLDLPAGQYFFLDVPADPGLRGVLWVALKGNPVVWVAESSDSQRAREAIRRSVINLDKPMTVIISCPTDHWEVEPNRKVWEQEVEKLRARIKELGLPIEIVDLSSLPGDEAVAEVQKRLRQGEAQVLGFLHVPEANAFEVGQRGRLDKEKIRTAGPSTVEESFKAIVGCGPLLHGLNDVFIESRLTSLTLTVGEEFDLSKISILIERWGELIAQGKEEATIQELFPDREWGKMGRAEPFTEHDALG